MLRLLVLVPQKGLIYSCRLFTSVITDCYFSPDYDAPLSEAGDITEKFQALKKVLENYNSDADKRGD